MISEKEILEGNKLIAKFDHRLNFKNDKKNFAEWIGCINGEIGNAFMSSQLKYHSSWDWLMPAVEKIHTTEEYTEEYTSEQVIYDPILQAIPLYGIRGVWSETVEFIKWYNQNKNDSRKNNKIL